MVNYRKSNSIHFTNHSRGLELHLQENQVRHYSRVAPLTLILRVSRYSRLHLAFPLAQLVLDGPAERT